MYLLIIESVFESKINRDNFKFMLNVFLLIKVVKCGEMLKFC